MLGWLDNHLGEKMDNMLSIHGNKKIPDQLKLLECKIWNCKGARGKSISIILELGIPFHIQIKWLPTDIPIILKNRPLL